MHVHPEFEKALTALAAPDKNGRGPSRLCQPEYWGRAAALLKDARRVAVISGFFVPSANAPETDGPGGAVILARAFLEHGAEARLWTDTLCLEAMQQCAAAANFPEDNVTVPDIAGILDAYRPDALIFTERLGRAVDGRYYNIRKTDVSAWTPPLDELAYRCAAAGIPTVGIGDGGNETGMGNFYEELSAMMPDYKDCLSVVETTVTLPVDVSNWGCYALTAALSHVWNEWRGNNEGDERAMLEALRRCNVVDGISKNCDLSVDGFPLALQESVVSELFTLWHTYKK